ncbi:MAG: hypothetical protein E7644_06335 [Ruminococcaceae bacterium]|nr:hypothetical protein [Oscillospiraceae bacterium]
MTAEALREAVLTARKNLAVWRRGLQPEAELCRLQYAALARHAAKAFHAGTWRDLGELRGFLAPLSNAAEGSLPPLEAAMGAEERLALAAELLRLLPELFPEPAEAQQSLAGPVAALDNPFFAAAAERFAPLTGDAPILTVPAFADVCEAVSRGNACFGILPLEDSADGKLLHVYEQIDRFELHISHTADISYPDGSKTVRFALFSHTEPISTAVAGEGMLECSQFGENRGGLVELLNTALATGLSLRRIDAIPAPYGADGFFYHPIFRTAGGNVRLFEAYLACFMPRTTITARYVHI